MKSKKLSFLAMLGMLVLFMPFSAVASTVISFGDADPYTVEVEHDLSEVLSVVRKISEAETDTRVEVIADGKPVFGYSGASDEDSVTGFTMSIGDSVTSFKYQPDLPKLRSALRDLSELLVNVPIQIRRDNQQLMYVLVRD